MVPNMVLSHRIPLLSGFPIPPQGFRVVEPDAVASFVLYAEVHLGLGVAQVGRSTEPLRSRCHVPSLKVFDAF
jgi:hypothetical protein